MKTPFPTIRGHPVGLSLVGGLVALASMPALSQSFDFDLDSTIATGDHPYQLVVADFNGDDIPDCAVTNTGPYPSGIGQLGVHLGTGTGTFQTANYYTAGRFPSGIASGDFNADGAPDLVAVNRFGGSLTVYLNANNGTGTMLGPPTTVGGLGSQPMHAAAGHFNADTHLDMAVAAHGSDAVRFVYGDGMGGFSLGPLIGVGDGPNGVAVTDLNHDGHDDAVLTNWYSYTVRPLLGHGDGTYTLMPHAPIGPRSWTLATGDFNDDGHADVAAPNALNNTLSILLGKGDGTFHPQTVMGTGASVYDLAIADLDLDGALDIVMASQGLRIFRGAGDGTFTGPQVIPAPNAFPGIGVVELDGNCAPDLVVSNSNHDSISVYLQDPPNRPPVADAGEDVTVECEAMLTPVMLSGTASDDCDGDPLAFDWQVASGSGASFDDPSLAEPLGWFPLGSTMVTLTVTDPSGASDSADVTVSVIDTVAPVATCTTDLAVLWPPNNKLRPVLITVEASDACASADTITVDCLVSSDEPDNRPPAKKRRGDVDGEDGHTLPVPVDLSFDSASGRFDGVVWLRAERLGSGDGRTYSIDCTVSDSSGNHSSASCVVLVPHDRGKRKKGGK